MGTSRTFRLLSLLMSAPREPNGLPCPLLHMPCTPDELNSLLHAQAGRGATHQGMLEPARGDQPRDAQGARGVAVRPLRRVQAGAGDILPHGQCGACAPPLSPARPAFTSPISCNLLAALQINYLDRYLGKVPVTRANFQLVGIAALWLAAKFEEVSYPSAAQLLDFTDDSYK